MLPVSVLQRVSPLHFTTSTDTQQSDDYEEDFVYDDNFHDDQQPGPSSYQRPGKTSNTTRPNLTFRINSNVTNLDITSTINDATQHNIADDDDATPDVIPPVISAPPTLNTEVLTFQQGRQLLRDHMLTTHLVAERRLEGALSPTC